MSGSSFDNASVGEVNQPVGTNYCGPAVPNSSGLGGTISAFGSTLVSSNNVELTASDLPPMQFGYFLNSMSQGFFSPPGSNGFLCLGAPFGRHNQPGLVGQGPTFSIKGAQDRRVWLHVPSNESLSADSP